MIIDSHCHLDSFKKIEIPKGILPITIGYSHKSNKKNVEIAKKYNVPYVLGIAPQTAIFEGLDELDDWILFIKSQNPVAIGEIGLDFHWSKNEQHIKDEYFLFDKMLNLAEEMNLPTVIHSRKAEKEVFEILKERKIENFLMHCYAGDVSLAQEIISSGGLISIPPIHSKKRKEVIRKIPLECLVVETDAPYISRSIDGVKKAIEYIAEVQGIEISLVAEQTVKNTIRFFGLKGYNGYF